MRVGFVTIWFERGAAYVTHMLRDVVAREHETFILARTGAVWGKRKLDTTGYWAVSNLTTWAHYRIPGEVLAEWVRANSLDLIVFNEEYDWGLPAMAKSLGLKVATYLDFYRDSWRGLLPIYDAVLCSTKRTYKLVKDYCPAYYIGWAVDTELFRPQRECAPFTFFHNAGWLGNNYRKGTPSAVEAYCQMLEKWAWPGIGPSEPGLFIHAQVDWDKLPKDTQCLIHATGSLYYFNATVPAPGKYDMGKCLLFPSKLEGLGLPLLEALACGLSVIATDAPPMNEFVEDAVTGWLVPVKETVRRADGISFPETLIDVDALAATMHCIAADPSTTAWMGRKAREYALRELSMDGLAERVNAVLEGL